MLLILGPGNICPKKPKPIIRPTDKNAVRGEGKSCEEIREYEDQLLTVEDESSFGDKATPEYNIVYKQAVTSEDVFLQVKYNYNYEYISFFKYYKQICSKD